MCKRGQKVTVRAPWGAAFPADKCMVPELRRLWKKGLRTEMHCCGHGTGVKYVTFTPTFRNLRIAQRLGARFSTLHVGRDWIRGIIVRDHAEPWLYMEAAEAHKGEKATDQHIDHRCGANNVLDEAQMKDWAAVVVAMDGKGDVKLGTHKTNDRLVFNMLARAVNHQLNILEKTARRTRRRQLLPLPRARFKRGRAVPFTKAVKRDAGRRPRR